MATRTATRSVLPGIRRRLYSSQAAARPNQSESTPLPRQDPKLTRLPNGILVASLENYSPVSRVSVAFHAGARFEDGDNNGVTHCLRAASYLSNKNSSNFKLAKSSQQIGSNITCAAGREYIHYTLECTRDNVSTGLSFLNDITSPTFKPWELAEFQPRLAFDRAVLAMQPNIEVIELLHEAAFKKTLGQSLYAPQYMIGNYSQEQLLSYVNQFFTSDRMAIVGVGVDHDYLCEQGSRFNPANPTGNDGEPVVYLGGELRKPSRSDLVYAAVGAEGPSLSGKDVLPSGVLQMIMGTGPYVKYSQGLASSRLAQAAASATSEPFAISCINANYQLSGLFGFCAAAQAKDIGKVLKTAFSQFASVTKNGVTEQELARGKAQLKSAISMQLEDGYNMALHLGEDVLTHKQITSLSELSKAIDAVTVSDVVAVAKRIVNGKPSMASVGNLTHTPCLDELYK